MGHRNWSFNSDVHVTEKHTQYQKPIRIWRNLLKVLGTGSGCITCVAIVGSRPTTNFGDQPTDPSNSWPAYTTFLPVCISAKPVVLFVCSQN